MRTRQYCKESSCRKWANINDLGYCPQHASDSSVSVSNDTPTSCRCIICKEGFDEESKAIGCDLCKGWCHDRCAGQDDLVKLLYALSNINNESTQNFHGVLLWMCPNCANESETKGKAVEITNNTCKLIEKNEPTGGPLTPICKKYRHGICQEGDKCKFSHPAKCLDYCRYGRDGCSEGFNKCKLLHPILCRGSLNYNQCFDSTCTLAHLKGTKRFSDQNLSNKQRQVPYQNISSQGYPKGNGQSKYSRFDPNYLGFQRYRPSYQRQNNSNYLSSEHPKINGEFQSGSANNMQSNGFSYSSNEFPALHMSGAPSDGYNLPSRNGLLNSHQGNNEHFLELLESMKSIQMNQRHFQQELMALKLLIPTPQRSIAQGFYNPQVQAPVTAMQEPQLK